jgi:hypothetical protein
MLCSAGSGGAESLKRPETLQQRRVCLVGRTCRDPLLAKLSKFAPGVNPTFRLAWNMSSPAEAALDFPTQASTGGQRGSRLACSALLAPSRPLGAKLGSLASSLGGVRCQTLPRARARHAGLCNVSSVWQYQEWKNVTAVTSWNAHAEAVRGTDAFQFRWGPGVVLWWQGGPQQPTSTTSSVAFCGMEARCWLLSRPCSAFQLLHPSPAAAGPAWP